MVIFQWEKKGKKNIVWKKTETKEGEGEKKNKGDV